MGIRCGVLEVGSGKEREDRGVSENYAVKAVRKGRKAIKWTLSFLDGSKG